MHFHCCVIDGVCAASEGERVQFPEPGALTPEDLAAVQPQVRAPVLRCFARAGHLDHADARDMAGRGHHGGMRFMHRGSYFWGLRDDPNPTKRYG